MKPDATGSRSAGAVRLDSHHHFWRPSRGDYHWMSPDDPALAPLRRDFLPPELAALMQAADVRHSVLVQAAATEAETAFMLEIAEVTPWVAGVVGWVDLAAPDCVSRLIRMATNSKLRGIRPMLQDLPDPHWLLRAPGAQVWDAMTLLELKLDALVKVDHLPMLELFARQHAGLEVVIDHAAKPALRDGWSSDGMSYWRSQMRSLAQQPQLHCKFSGLFNEASVTDVATMDKALHAIRPVWEFLLEHFGPSRLMWGSDWPVLNLAGNYERWVAVSDALIGELSPHEQNQIWSANAVAFYGLKV
ncbi:amidohydrolase family protein [Roseateles sp.]|uniref:amidohydrolase family protein n=1 Tax=Roseateles sp. TaxID=1971397 RepID=UPI003D0B6358